MWHITYYNRKVFDSIQKMPKRVKARYIALTDKMVKSGPNLGMPHTRAMHEGLFEIRVKAKEGSARFFYCLKIKNEIVILHAFMKKEQKTPIRQLEIAKNRMQEIKENG